MVPRRSVLLKEKYMVWVRSSNKSRTLQGVKENMVFYFSSFIDRLFTVFLSWFYNNSILSFNRLPIFTECLNKIFTVIISYLSTQILYLLSSSFYQALILPERGFWIFPTNSIFHNPHLCNQGTSAPISLKMLMLHFLSFSHGRAGFT